MPPEEFLRAQLGALRIPVCRIGLSATYRPGRETIFKALDEGLNYLFYYGIDSQMTSAVRSLPPSQRDQLVLATGAYNYLVRHQNLRRTLEKRLRQVKTDHIDVFHFLGVTKPKQFTQQIRDELAAVRASGLVRGVALSTHDRKFAAQLAREGIVDAIMIRYNAAHRGAETEIFPEIRPDGVGVVSYTATRWTGLLRRPRGYPKQAPIPNAGICYRFVLSNASVHVCLMAPSNLAQFESNLSDIRKGPLPADEMHFLRDFGDVVYQRRQYFM